MLFIHFPLQCITHHSTMTSEYDQISNVAGDAATFGSRSGAAVESEAPSSTSSSTMADQAIANKVSLLLYD
jgi:hypothetical protein